jgi:23S rRNA (uracil1939-C5)-methyltransferase
MNDAQHETGTLCPHFGECGGCQIQDLPYARQLEAKAADLEALFAPFWSGPITITPSPVSTHYRNKVDPSFAPKRYDEPPPPGFTRDTVLGFKKKGRWFWPLDITDCRIGPEGMGRLLEAVRGWYRKHDLRAFDTNTGEGYLRCLLLREGKRTGERMAVLITRDGVLPAESFVESVMESWPADSIYHGIFRRAADVAAADELRLLHGAAYITEALHLPEPPGVRCLRFRISPFSFFQTNTLGTEGLYAAVREWAARIQPALLYDLYGGMGGIAFSCAGCAGKVVSVENVAPASEDGRANAAENGIENVTFITEKVKNFLKYRLEEGESGAGSAAVVDPPRSAMHPKALRRLIELGPDHLCYISCNPKLLAREMPALLEGYTLTGMQAVDLFPHTRHVEAVAFFKR